MNASAWAWNGPGTPALSPEQVEQCRRMAEEGASQRQIARILNCSPTTVKKALEPSGKS